MAPHTMSLHVAVLLCVTIVGLSLVDAAPSRNRRSLWELDTLVECYTGRSALMMINGYGCWCGFGGSGTPVDDTDGCCQQHDFCYGILQENNCGVYFTSYGYTKHGCDTGRGYVTCSAEVDTCERALCECDRNLATCLRRNSDTYNEAFANFEKSFCDAVDASPSTNNDIPTSYNSTSMLTVVNGRERDAYQVDTANELGTGPVVAADNAPVRGVLRQLDMRRSDGVN